MFLYPTLWTNPTEQHGLQKRSTWPKVSSWMALTLILSKQWMKARQSTTPWQIWLKRPLRPSTRKFQVPRWGIFFCFSCKTADAFLIPIRLHIFFWFLGLFWCCLVTQVHWQALLWLRDHRRILRLAVCNVLRWAEPDRRGLHRKGKCPTRPNTKRFDAQIKNNRNKSVL